MSYVYLKQTLPIFFIWLALPLAAQYQLNGTAKSLGNDCFQLTPAKDGAQSSIWFTPKINLNQSFDFTTQFNFGCSNGGADGMTFAMHPDASGLGGGGGGLGFIYLWPAIGIEFDNHKNNDFSDPDYDHIAILANGIVDHNNSNYHLAGPIQTDPDDENVEDCEDHEIRITWNAETYELQVFFDCQLRLSYTGDIVNRFFEGDPMVHWGFTAATGAKNNEQTVCLEKIKFIDPLPNYVMCPGGAIQFAAKGGQQYTWAPAESLNNPNIANPLATPEVTTTYYVTITDGCVEFFDSLVIEVAGNPVDFSFTDTTLCQGETIILDATTENATYNWSDGSTASTLSPSSSDYYIVTVTVDDLCVSNAAAKVDFIRLPYQLPVDYPTICPGETLLLDATFDNATYLWQDGSTDAIFTVTKAGEYMVTIDHFCGTKTLSADIGFEASCIDVFIPNIFSPNFDGFNDYFTIQDGGDIQNISLFRIADRWGNLVFEARDFQANDQTFGWDGTLNGKAMLNGVYIYFAEITFRDGTTVIVKGDVTLVR